MIHLNNISKQNGHQILFIDSSMVLLKGGRWGWLGNGWRDDDFPPVVAEPTLRYIQRCTEADVEVCLAAVRQWWLGIPRQRLSRRSSRRHKLTQQRDQVSPPNYKAWPLILSRNSVTCFGYSPLKYSKVRGLAV